MQERAEALAQELAAVSAVLNPVHEEARRLAAIEEEMAAEVQPVVRPKEKRAAEEDFDQELEILDLEEGIRKQAGEADSRVAALEAQLNLELQEAAQAAAQVESKRAELKRRIESATDEGEKRRLLAQLDDVNRQWQEQLAHENEAQHKQLRAALEARRLNRKKATD